MDDDRDARPADAGDPTSPTAESDPTPGVDPFRDVELDAAIRTQGPLPTATAWRVVDRARARLEANDPGQAALEFQRVVGHADPDLTGAALLGLGDSLYRLDHDAQAREAWIAATRLPDNPSTYAAWRNLAGMAVRAGDLDGAIRAYREADRRAPAEERAEIASRLGWLAKETGNAGAANRYFARSRGATSLGLAQLLVIATSIVSLVALSDPEGRIFTTLWLNPDDIRHGALYQLFTVTLVHAPGGVASWFSIHLLFNMYALWLLGPIVEGAWGRRMFVAFYLLSAAAASTASFLFSNAPAVGASGAIFGLVGVLLAGTRAHHPMLDRRARAIVPQLGFFVLINLAFGFAVGGAIDNAAHIGGLVAGMWLGFVVPPGKVPTLRSAWQNLRGGPAERSPLLVVAGVALLVAVVAVGLALGGATFAI